MKGGEKMHPMRRTDREVADKGEQQEILDRCEICRIGLCADGEVYIVPLNFGYEFVDTDLVLYFHSATQGRKLDMVEKNPHVCFEMDCDTRLIPGQGCDFSYAYASLMGEGVIETLTHPKEKEHAFDMILRKYAGDNIFFYRDEDMERTCVLKLTVDWMTGKRHRVESTS